jgi:hypothetical protein
VPLIHSKSNSSTKRGQTHETVLFVYNFIEKEAQGARDKRPNISLQKTDVESAEEGGRGN